MKKIVWILVFVTCAFAGREEISMLNQQILTLQASKDELIVENKKITDSLNVLEAQVSNLDSIRTEQKNSLEDQKQKIVELEKKLKNAVTALETISRPTTTPVVAATSSTTAIAVTSLFPITSTIMTKKAYDGSNIAALLSFYNASAESVASFESRLHFSQNGEELLVCPVSVNKPVKYGENVTWYGALPYNPADSKNARFFDADPSLITVNVEVLSVTLTNGTVRKFK